MSCVKTLPPSITRLKKKKIWANYNSLSFYFQGKRKDAMCRLPARFYLSIHQKTNNNKIIIRKKEPSTSQPWTINQTVWNQKKERMKERAGCCCGCTVVLYALHHACDSLQLPYIVLTASTWIFFLFFIRCCLVLFPLRLYTHVGKRRECRIDCGTSAHGVVRRKTSRARRIKVFQNT